MTAPLVVWDPRMLGYDLGGDHPLHPLRWELTWALAGDLGVLDAYQVLDARTPPTTRPSARIHTPAYIAAVREASERASRPRWGTGWAPRTTRSSRACTSNAALIAGGSVQAAQAIARGEVDRAVNFCGGLHHAMADYASGFCVYNDAALAIRALLDAGVRKVAYVDVDAHHGDGVQAAFYDDPRVLTVSIHETPAVAVPGHRLARRSWAAAPAQGTAVNIALPPGTSDAAWLRAFHAVVPGVVRRLPAGGAGHPARRRHPSGGPAGRPEPDHRRAAHRPTRRCGTLAESVTGGRWLALGGGGYCAGPGGAAGRGPTCWRSSPAATSTRRRRCRPTGSRWPRAARPDIELPIDMTDGTTGPVAFERWDGSVEMPVDRAILNTRNAIYPLHGLDPHDPRD